jgi:hypothetical protein
MQEEAPELQMADRLTFKVDVTSAKLDELVVSSLRDTHFQLSFEAALSGKLSEEHLAPFFTTDYEYYNVFSSTPDKPRLPEVE